MIQPAKNIVPASAGDTSLSLLAATISVIDPTEYGYGFRRRIELLREAHAADPELQRTFAQLQKLTQTSNVETRTGLAAELAVPNSISREVFRAYLEWVSHRGAKAAPEPAEEQERRRKVDTAFLQTRVDAIIDLVIERVVQLNIPISPEAATNFLSLFSGGAARIQSAINCWMLNGKVGDLVDTEKALYSEQKLDSQALFTAIETLNSLDGGTPVGFQKPLRPGERRAVSTGRIEYGFLPIPAQVTSAMVVARHPIAAASEETGLVNVMQQSVPTSRALSGIQAHIRTLDPQSREYAETQDLYAAYISAVLYDSGKLWASKGMLDKIFEAAVKVGDRGSREATLELLYTGIDKLRARLHKQVTGRDAYLGLSNLVLSREDLDKKTLDFVLSKLSALASGATPSLEEILRVRRATPPDPTKLIVAMQQNSGILQKTALGPYKMELATRNQTLDGRVGKVLEIRDLKTGLDFTEDTEFFETIRLIEEHARSAGYTAIQLAQWRNIHEARVFRSSGEYQEIEGPKNQISLTPTFIKLLRAAPYSYDEYLARQFAAANSLDLSAESAFLGLEACRYKQTHGGKGLGLALLEKLVTEFGDSRLKLLPYLVATAQDLKSGISVPESFATCGAYSQHLIARSNAAFEYGSPPGILNSIGRIPVPSNGILRIETAAAESLFARTVAANKLDSRTSFFYLVQPQLHPRASGVVYSSFSAKADEPTLVEASLGPPVSATVGLPNLIHYRLTGKQVQSYRNFLGEHPGVVFVRENCFIDPVESDPCRRELDLYRSVASELEAKSGSEIGAIWHKNTFQIISEPNSPLKSDELTVLHDFAKFAEKKLGKPLKLEFGVGMDGMIYLLQLDPAMLEVSDTLMELSTETGDLLIDTPFVNMPIHADGLSVVYEAAGGMMKHRPTGPFFFVSESVPFNLNIQSELLGPNPECRMILSASGSRMNHCYSEARTFVPFVGCVDLASKLEHAFGRLNFGDNPNIKLDIRSDGRRAKIRIYK